MRINIKTQLSDLIVIFEFVWLRVFALSSAATTRLFLASSFWVSPLYLAMLTSLNIHVSLQGDFISHSGFAMLLRIHCIVCAMTTSPMLVNFPRLYLA
jgi:hypothetical protein